MKRVLLVLIAAGLAGGCESGLCAVHPTGGDPCGIGMCDAVVGYYFASGQCYVASGCGCNECCRTQLAPFRTEQECREACLWYVID